MHPPIRHPRARALTLLTRLRFSQAKAAGKWNAVKTDHAKEFAQLNCIPLLLWVLTNIQRSAAPTTTIIPAFLLAAYAFTGFVEA